MTDFTMSVRLPDPYEVTLDRVRALLGEAGFGVITEIDLRATLKAKLDVDVEPRTILGACRPELAYRALQADSRVAALLPCNVVVAAAGSGSTVDVFDPGAMSLIGGGAELDGVASDAKSRLAGMMARLTSESEATHATRP